MPPKKTSKKREEEPKANQADVNDASNLDETPTENDDRKRTLTKAELFYLENSQDTDRMKAEELGVSLDMVVSNKASAKQNTNFMVRDPKKGFAVMTRAAAEQENPKGGKRGNDKRGHIHNPLQKADD
jgi:hypothetical protein